MTPESGSALNVGELLQRGVRLSAAEAVAVVHTACTQVSWGAERSLPGGPDEVWITDEGTLRITRTVTTAERSRAAVATLLEALLPPPTDDALYAVPRALRTLPARLRESGEAASSGFNDLLMALSLYLPSDPREVLQRLVRRQREDTRPAETEGATSTLVFNDNIADLPLQLDGAAPPLPRHVTNRNRAPLIAVSLLIFAAAGFVGYRLTLRTGEPAPVSTSDSAPPAAPLEPRIIERERQQGSDGTRLTFARPAPLLLPVADGAFSPSFAANGTMLFHAGRNSSGQLFATTVDLDGNASATEPLIRDRARNYHPRLSPDGTRMAFDSDREGERAVYVADRNGDRVTRVSGRGYAAVPSWSPDGTLLAYIKAEPGRPRVWNLWLLNLATGEAKQHTTFRIGQVWGASWFPDGRKLAYSHEDRLIVSDLQTGTQEVHLSPVKSHLVRTPAVSPDARRIVFQVYRDGVWMLDTVSGTMRRVLDDVTAEEFSWDTDGHRIAFHSRRDGHWRIWLLTS